MRNLTLDQARIILSILVIINHSAFLKDYSAHLNYFFTQSAFRFSVPTFFIVGGFFFYSLISKHAFSGFKRWFMAILLLHTFWSIVYLYFYIPVNASLLEIAVEVAKRYIEGYWHLWFTMGLLGAGVCMFILKKQSSHRLFILSIILFLTGCFIQYAGNYHLFGNSIVDKIFNKTHIYRNFLLFSLPFFIIGFLIARENLQTRFESKHLFIIFSISWVLLCLEGAINTLFIGDLRQHFDMLFLQFASAISLFLLLIKSARKTTSDMFAKVSAGIYFSHPLFLLILPDYITSKTLVFIFTVVLSVLTAVLLTKISVRLKFIL
jgi:fucose 4-O-acetylase-like acetyltransferase